MVEEHLKDSRSSFWSSSNRRIRRESLERDRWIRGTSTVICTAGDRRFILATSESLDIVSRNPVARTDLCPSSSITTYLFVVATSFMVFMKSCDPEQYKKALNFISSVHNRQTHRCNLLNSVLSQRINWRLADNRESQLNHNLTLFIQPHCEYQ